MNDTATRCEVVGCVRFVTQPVADLVRASGDPRAPKRVRNLCETCRDSTLIEYTDGTIHRDMEFFK